MQDPITAAVAIALEIDPESADDNAKAAAKLAAGMLRKMGYERKYCHEAWNRGMRWYAPGSSIPMPNQCATTILGVALCSTK